MVVCTLYTDKMHGTDLSLEPAEGKFSSHDANVLGPPRIFCTGCTRVGAYVEARVFVWKYQHRW